MAATPEEVNTKVERIRRKKAAEGERNSPSATSSPFHSEAEKEREKYTEREKKRIMMLCAELEEELEKIRIGEVESDSEDRVKYLKRKIIAIQRPHPKLKIVNGRLAWIKDNGKVAKRPVSVKATLRFFRYLPEYFNGKSARAEILAGDPYQNDQYLIVFFNQRRKKGIYLISKASNDGPKHTQISKKQAEELKPIIEKRPQDRTKLDPLLESTDVTIKISEKEEENFKEIVDSRRRFKAVFNCNANRMNRFSFLERVIVLKDIEDCESGDRIATQYPVRYTKGFMKLGQLRQGDSVEFDAKAIRFHFYPRIWRPTRITLKTEQKRQPVFRFTELTDDQREALSTYREKWRRIGSSTEPAYREKAEVAIGEIYQSAKLSPPKAILWLKSPAACIVAYAILKGKAKKQFLEQGYKYYEKLDEVMTEVEQYKDCSTGSYVSYDIRYNPREQANKKILDLVWKDIHSEIYKELQNQSLFSLRCGLKDALRRQFDPPYHFTNSLLKNFIHGQHDSFWLSRYDYMQRVLGIEFLYTLEGLKKYSTSAGWGLLFENLSLVSERTNVCNAVENGLHCESGPVVRYPDGYSLYALNRIVVPKEYVETPADELDCELVIREDNVERRRELVRKIGIERIFKELNAKILDSWNGYELMELNIKGMWIRPIYLKMNNPSSGELHIEGVPPEIKTCKEALSWRVGGLKWLPEQLT